MRISIQTHLALFNTPNRTPAPQPTPAAKPEGGRGPAPSAIAEKPASELSLPEGLPDPADFEGDGAAQLFLKMLQHAMTNKPQATEPTGGAAPAAEAPTAETPATEAPSAAAPRREAPFISQLHPDGAEDGYTNGPNNCGPATMAMIGRANGYGEGKTDAQLINHLGEMGGTSEAGTGVNGIAAMADGMGLPSETRGPGADVNWIAEQVKAGKMVAANGNYYAMDPHRDAGAIAEGRGGHYVAVVGMDDAGNFQVHDPFHDNGGAPMTYTPAELEEYINANSNGGYQVAVGEAAPAEPVGGSNDTLAGMSEAELKELGATDRKAYLEALRPAAEEAERRYGVPAAVTLAQAALETGWGESIIDGYNLFGIKGSGPAGSINLPTTEYVDGAYVPQNADFARYHNFDEAVLEHGELFHNGYYDQAVSQYAQDQDPEAFARNITGIYATDPAYGDKLIGIMREYGLI